jgi:hypothetical protein
MKYLAITQIDARTKILCTEQPMRTGPDYPQIKNCNIVWCNKSTWPIPTTPQGALTRPPLFYGTCDDDADTSIPGVVRLLTELEYSELKTAEHQARKPFSSWIGDEETMTWSAPTLPPDDGKAYYWDEPTLSWNSQTLVVEL